jgi:hypothetical protein
MQCPQCQLENPVEANFCLNCGNRLATVCPQCQQVLPPAANFCMACGHNLAATHQSAQPATQRVPDPTPLSYTPPYLRLRLDPLPPASADAFLAGLLRLRGDIHGQNGHAESTEAERSYKQALTLATELGMRPLQAHCHRGPGTLYGQTGKSEQARTELSAAIEMYRDMDMTFWLPETEAALAAVEGTA